ncbi:T9SS type A sorting domain-containing protein [Reichenbachiella versicolor]|uniref:T9SS type A sorting domain-containing protein n=1 Tax=Reichenbachiella versicolor TaxID=1821036 RepID=UPI000D6E5247|nr:T9SS type A sorting domain-containing protein [Reichenbachiella versicolor]
MKTKCLLIVAMMILSIVQNSWAGGPNYYKGKGRIALSSDGNKHDNDDMLATMLTLMILAKGELHEQTVLYTYADHIWGSEKNDLARMKASINGSDDRWNFWNTKFMAAVENPQAAYNAFKDEIVKSTANDPLFIVAAGPMQVVGEGLKRANAELGSSLNHVTVISHSTWNERHSDNPAKGENHSGWTWKEMKNNFGSKVNFVEIDDQNGAEPNPYGDQNDFSASWNRWTWMKNHPDPSVNWVYTRGKSILGRGDYSDAGMVYYLIHNDEFGNYNKLKNWIGSDFIPVGKSNPIVKELISIAELPATVSPTTLEIPVKVSYTAKTGRDIDVVIKTPQNVYITNKTVSISAGKKQTTIKVKLPNGQPVGKNYLVRVALRPKGGNWQTNIVQEDAFFDVVSKPKKEAISVVNIPASITNAQTQISIKVGYTATTGRDIDVVIKTPQNVYITNKTVSVSAGTKQTTIKVTLPKGLAKGNNYLARVALRPKGGDWRTNIAQEDAFFNMVASNARVIDTDEPSIAQVKISSYPNPTTGILNVTCQKGAVIKVMNAVGREVDSHIVTTTNTVLNLESLSKGTYYLNISSGKGSQTQRLIIK